MNNIIYNYQDLHWPKEPELDCDTYSTYFVDEC